MGKLYNTIDKWFESLQDETEDGSYAAATTLATGNKLCDEEDINKLKKKILQIK